MPPYFRKKTLPGKPTVIEAAVDHGELISPTDSMHYMEKPPSLVSGTQRLLSEGEIS
ncbi:MAG: hypothetical protein U9R43_11980 [Thermodesulfobacteriota bacterium]|nr:hypothetical protein [Thermodesulfobacteriota bacterium]